MSRIDISKLVLEGIRASANEGNEAELRKAGNLRGGSSGVLFPDGNIAGSCHRATYARLKGSKRLLSNIYEGDQLHTEESKELMFEAGRLNEDAWAKWLEASSYQGKILREEQIPSVWYTKNGTPVTGRPDIVLCDRVKVADKPDMNSVVTVDGKMYKPREGIELKYMCSFWTVRSVVMNNMPKFGHLIQSAQYSMSLDIPYQLWYTSGVNYSGPTWAQNLVPAWGEEGSENIEYRYYGPRVATGTYKTGKKKGQTKWSKPEIAVPEIDRYLPAAELKAKYGIASGEFFSTKPTLKGFYLQWLNDTLHYQSTTDGELYETDITKDAIRGYYEYISKIDETQDLGPRPLNLKADGSQESYTLCKFCPFSQDCDSYEQEHKSFEQWVKGVL